MKSTINFFALQKLINVFIRNGKKTKSIKIFLYLLKELKKKETQLAPLTYLSTSLNNIMPELYSSKVRKSSKVFYLPKMITEEKKIKVSLHWIKKSSGINKIQHKLEDRLTTQVVESFNFQGQTIKKKESLYNLLLSNRPFLHNIMYRN